MLAPSALDAQASDATPPRFATSRFEVIAVDEVAGADTVADSALVALVERCRSVMEIGADVGASAASTRQLPTIHGSAESDVITFVVVRRAGSRVVCGDRPTQMRATFARGLAISFDARALSAHELAGVTLMRGDVAVRGVDFSVDTLALLTPDGLVHVAGGLARLVVPQAAIFPVGTEEWVALSFELRFATGDSAERLDVPPDVVSDLRARALPGRFAMATRLPPDSRVVLLRTEAAQDSGLAAAQAAYASGQFTQASIQALQRLAHGDLGRADQRAARVQLGLTALAHGDSAAARVLFAAARSADPCLGLSSDAGPTTLGFYDEVARLVDNAEGGATCRRTPLLRVALRGALLPGFGRPAGPSRRAAGANIAIPVAALVLTGYGLHVESKERYREYRVLITPGPENESIYQDSESLRKRALWHYRAAAILWAGSALEAIWSEYRHHRRADALAQYGTAPARRLTEASGITPIVGADRIGLAITFR